jgi:arsenical pump membrane protein
VTSGVRPAGAASSGEVPPGIAWTVLGAGLLAALVAAAADPAGAGGAASQDWPPFVLVAGLLLVGVVAAEDGVFEAAGRGLDRLASGGPLLYGASMALVAVVTALLNLDTSVTFLTPVLVAAARHRRARSGQDLGLPMLYGCLLMSNAASLLLPGSNLTNLIVLGHLHLSGGAFAARMAPAWLVASVLTALVLGLAFRSRFAPAAGPAPAGPLSPVPGRRRPGLVGSAAVVAATILVVTLRSPAVAVLVVGVAVVLLREATARTGRSGHAAEHGTGHGTEDVTADETEGRAPERRSARHLVGALGGPLLPGLFGVAVGAGTLGRAWQGPSSLLAHLSAWLTAPLAAVLSVLVNNLPAASLLAARHPPQPFSVLVGLDLGPNLLVTGSLSSILWWQQARLAGARPSALEVSRLGLLSVPLAMAAALAVLAATGSH